MNELRERYKKLISRRNVRHPNGCFFYEGIKYKSLLKTGRFYAKTDMVVTPCTRTGNV